jgi:hypothetical protein
MKRLFILALVLATQGAVLAQEGPHSANPSGVMQQHLQMFEEYTKLFNSGDVATLASFISEHESENTRKATPPGQAAQMEMSLPFCSAKTRASGNGERSR